MIKKNDEFIITIEDIGVNGEGIGHVDGLALFVKDAVIGDVVRVRVMKMQKNYGFAKLLEVVEASKDRVCAECSIARSCGGCQIQEMDYQAQLRFKTKKVKENLERIGKIDFQAENAPVFHDCLGMEKPWRYRNKAQFPIGKKDGKITAGFYAGRTHTIIPCDDCRIGIEENKTILDIVITHMEQYHIPPYDEETHKGVVRHVLIRKGFHTGQLMVCLVINAEQLKAGEELTEKLKKLQGMTSISLNINKQKTNKILGDKIVNLYGEGYITDTIGDINFRISPLSFYQVNPVQTEKLYGTALQYAQLSGEENVFDLYCGVGTISLFLAKKAKSVTGVEIVPQAIEDAKKNAKINEIGNTRFYTGAAEEIIPELYQKGVTADVVVVDPPRKGCDEKLLSTIVDMKPDRLVYVSCDSATLARDVKYLTEWGFVLREVQPVDMFPHCSAVETVVLLSQQKPDDRIEVEIELDEMMEKYGVQIMRDIAVESQGQCLNPNISLAGRQS
jgi:23S rRNA (uracil1939-C5)-methyltransferase